MEYADAGDLSMVVKRQRELKQYLPESDILSWFVQIALGLQYIHKKKILHRVRLRIPPRMTTILFE